MTTTRTSAQRRSLRPGRKAALALLTSAGVLFSPVAAMAHPTAPAPAPPVAAAPAPVPSAAQVAVDTALAQQGKPYVWAGAGPNVYDCSGLSQFAYAAAGISLPHSSRIQATMGTPVARADLQPGDLVFFYSQTPSHVAIYAGNGQVIHAPRPGKKVEYIKMSYMPYAGAVRPG